MLIADSFSVNDVVKPFPSNTSPTSIKINLMKLSFQALRRLLMTYLYNN